MAETTDTKKAARYEYDGFVLSEDGSCLHGGRQIEWFHGGKSHKPWIPAKRKTFVSLVKTILRDGGPVYVKPIEPLSTEDKK